MRFTDLVNEHYADLNETELLMCNYIMENIDIIPTMSTLEFARNSFSSKSSVIRFSQKLGFTGFTELRNFIKWQDHVECRECDLQQSVSVVWNRDRLNFLPDWYHRADRIPLRLLVSRSVFHPCRFVRCRSGGHATAGLPARLWFLGWSNRLLDELLPVYQRLVAYSDRPCLRRHLLFRLLLRYC